MGEHVSTLQIEKFPTEIRRKRWKEQHIPLLSFLFPAEVLMEVQWRAFLALAIDLNRSLKRKETEFFGSTNFQSRFSCYFLPARREESNVCQRI